MPVPRVELCWHEVGALSYDEQKWVEERFLRALEVSNGRWPESPLAQYGDLEASVVSDEVLAQIHGDFLDDPTETDVITFPHGEILVSVEMAAQRAHEYGKDTKGELLLYLIHGLLHLVGFNDKESEERAEMHVLQDQVWDEVARFQQGPA